MYNPYKYFQVDDSNKAHLGSLKHYCGPAEVLLQPVELIGRVLSPINQHTWLFFPGFQRLIFAMT